MSVTGSNRAAASALVALLGVSWLLFAQPVSAVQTRNVLVLYSNNRLVPGNVAVDRGLRDAISSPADRPVHIFSEFLDQPEFAGVAYESTVATYVREKYAARPPDAIVAVGENSLDFLVRSRKQIFPDVPLVHAVVSNSHLRSVPALPADVVGVPIEYDFAGTIEQALRWHPNTKLLLIVTGASERDREWEARLRREVPSIVGGVTVEFLVGLPTASVLKRLGKLDANSLLFTPGYFVDGEGRLSSRRDAAALMAAASTAPVYGPFDTFIGTGVVGGRTPSFEAIGRQAAQIVNQLFAGAAPASLQLPAITPTALRVDWRQVRRWGIDERQIPADTVISFKEPTLWEAYRTAVIGAGAVILLLTTLVATLLFERGRRRRAELAVQEQRSQLAHASRLAIAGELTASIAHEINQPLGAILTNADTADLILQSGEDRREELRRIMTDIRRDDLRASNVIRRLRTLFATQQVERQPFDINEAMSDVATLLHSEARRRRVGLELRPAAKASMLVGDAVQIQQVLINLVLNAMDAVAEVPEERRTVVVSAERVADRITIAVHDQGNGIAPDSLTKLFDSFFTTKQTGMGLGLSIARSIVEAHGGRVWAENGAANGAVFYFELPAHSGRTIPSPV